MAQDSSFLLAKLYLADGESRRPPCQRPFVGDHLPPRCVGRHVIRWQVSLRAIGPARLNKS